MLFLLILSSKMHPGSHQTPATPYGAWAAASGLGAGPQAQPFADFELDGIVNLLEFALGSDPTARDLALLRQPGIRSVEVNGQTAEYLTLTYRKRRNAPSLSYTVEVSSDLSSWQPTSHQVGPPEDNGDGTDSVTMRDLQPIAAGVRRFIRLAIAEQ